MLNKQTTYFINEHLHRVSYCTTGRCWTLDTGAAYVYVITVDEAYKLVKGV